MRLRPRLSSVAFGSLCPKVKKYHDSYTIHPVLWDVRLEPRDPQTVIQQPVTSTQQQKIVRRAPCAECL